MKQDDLSKLAMTYFEKMKANYYSNENLDITPENVFQEGIRHNYALFIELVDRLMLPGSGVNGAKHLMKARDFIKRKETVLLLMKHAGNFDVPCFYSLLSKEGTPYHDILDRIVFIAGRKLNEESAMVKTFTEIFSRIVIVPNREIPRRTAEETTEQKIYREAFLQEASRINRAALRKMMQLKKEGRIIALFPLGGRPLPLLEEKGVKETTSYMKFFDYAYFIEMHGNLIPVGDRMDAEIPRRDRIIFNISKPVSTAAYLEESRNLFEKQTETSDFDQFNVDRVMIDIGQIV